MATVVHEPHRKRRKVLAECDGIPEAEDVIAIYEQIDPEGVHAGDYGIDATEDEDAEYQATPRR